MPSSGTDSGGGKSSSGSAAPQSGTRQGGGGASGSADTGRAQTPDERRGAIDKRLDDTLGTFDREIRKEQEKNAQERDARNAATASAGAGTADAESTTDSKQEGDLASGGSAGDEGPDGKDGKSSRPGDLKSDKERRADSGNASGGGAQGSGAGAAGDSRWRDDDVAARRHRQAPRQKPIQRTREAVEGIHRVQEKREVRAVGARHASVWLRPEVCTRVSAGLKVVDMFRRALIGLVSVGLLVQLGGCMVNETKPLPKVNAVQAKVQIPADELLDVGLHEFDVNITEEQLKDTDKLAKQRVYPDIRKAEARFIPTLLRSTLESSGQWGAVRVVPSNVEFVDVSVTGKIVESTGAKLVVEVSVQDSTGRQWITKKRYESLADTGSYKTDASLRARDPFQNVYSQIANDMVAARDALQAASRREIRSVTELRFAQDLAEGDGRLRGERREGHDDRRACRRKTTLHHAHRAHP
jgi:hypothetical protein